MDDARVKRIADLLEKTEEAHHQAYSATGGEDPEWAEWYSAHMVDELRDVSGLDLEERDLTQILKTLEERHKNEAPHIPWVTFYAAVIAAI